MGRVSPDKSGYKQTVLGRRKRLREALIEKLGARGWAYFGRTLFGQAYFVAGRKALRTGESDLAQAPRSTE